MLCTDTVYCYRCRTQDGLDAHGWAVQKRLYRSICRLGKADWCGSNEHPNHVLHGVQISPGIGELLRGDMCRPIIALIPHANVYVQRTRRTKVSTRWRKATKLKLQQNTCCSRYTKHGWMTVMTVSNQLVQHHIRNTYHWHASDGRTFFTVGPNHRQQSTFCLKSTISNVWNTNVQQISTHYDEAK